MADITKYDDQIDTRDIAGRIEELADEKSDLTEAITEAKEELQRLEHVRLVSGTSDEDDAIAEAREAIETAESALAEWDGEDELSTLCSLADELDNCNSEWRDGVALIRYSYFVDYAQQLAEDIGAIDASASWPNNCIDWDRAARELGYDYSTVTFGDVDYYIRST
jgi:hypothetical protein